MTLRQDSPALESADARPATGSPAETGAAHGAGLLVIRLGLGGLLLAHGIQKVFAFGIPGVTGSFEAAGVPAPGLAAVAAAVIETLGALLIIAGIGSRITSVLVICSMVVAMLTMHLPAGYFADAGGIELPLLIATTAAGLVLAGPGRLSVAGALGRSRSLIA